MEFVSLLGDNLGALAFGILALGAVIAFFYAGWMYQTAFGDQQQMAKARNAFFGGVIGLIIGGFAFVVPEVLSREVIEPSGGDTVMAQVAGECDGVLRSRLSMETHANTAERMNQLITLIQAGNPEGCGKDLWDPYVGDEFKNSVVSYFQYRIGCFGRRTGSTYDRGVFRNAPFRVGGVAVPGSLTYKEGVSGLPRNVSSRDARNNVLIYFGNAAKADGSPKVGSPKSGTEHIHVSSGRPTGGSECWMFIARENLWVTN